MHCRMCGLAGKFVKAHAIPEAFFRRSRGADSALSLIDSTSGQLPRRSPIGVYDQETLCDRCEPEFGALDDYGSKVLLNDFEKLFTPERQGGTVVTYSTDLVDQSRLLAFLVTVLWRASVSSQPFYSRVNLGSYEELAKAALTGIAADCFAAALSKWTASPENAVATKAIPSPFRERWGGVNAYRLYLGDVVAYIKVDGRPFPAKLRRVALGQQESLHLVTREFEKSKDLEAMIYAVHQSDASMELARSRRSGKSRET